MLLVACVSSGFMLVVYRATFVSVGVPSVVETSICCDFCGIMGHESQDQITCECLLPPPVGQDDVHAQRSYRQGIPGVALGYNRPDLIKQHRAMQALPGAGVIPRSRDIERVSRNLGMIFQHALDVLWGQSPSDGIQNPNLHCLLNRKSKPLKVTHVLSNLE
jgi:hypothetical protein